MLNYAIYFALLALTSAAAVNSNTAGGIIVPPLSAAASTTKQLSVEEREPPIAILTSESNRNPDGSFQFTFEGADGSFREEKGQVVQSLATKTNKDDEDEPQEQIEVSGSYRYYDADGQLIEVHYTAGKNGFIPRGTNIPVEISDAAQAAADAASADAQLERTDTKH